MTEQPQSQTNAGQMLAIGVHRWLHHAMIECTDKHARVCTWNGTPVQTACGKRFDSKRITLTAISTLPEGKCCMHRGCQQWLRLDRD